jgi:arginyl-tRNA synthetase
MMALLLPIKNLGVDFDKYYYRKQYLFTGKRCKIGLEKIFEQDPDGSVWIDLTDEGFRS